MSSAGTLADITAVQRPMPTLAVLDVDGTCIDARLRLHPRTRDAVRSAAQRVPVILATGRMYRSVLPWARELGVRQPVVCYQGALVRDQPHDGFAGAVLLEDALPGDVAARAIALAHRHGWHVQAYADDQLLCDRDRPEAHLYASIAQVPITFVQDLATCVSNGSTKVVCVSEDLAVVDDCIAAMRVELGNTARVTRSLPQFVEIVSPRVSKTRAVELLCARLGLRLGDAVAIGDAPNDMDVLAAAGTGVAVRGARPEVLAAADASCAPPDQAGVADVLEHLGLA